LNGLGQDRNILLIAGGQGKGADFRELLPAVAQHCKFVVLIGEAREQMRDCFGGELEELALASTMEQAVAMAAEHAEPGDCVLLSPACASFDMFSGYAQRGDAFSAAVMAMAGGEA